MALCLLHSSNYEKSGLCISAYMEVQVILCSTFSTLILLILLLKAGWCIAVTKLPLIPLACCCHAYSMLELVAKQKRRIDFISSSCCYLVCEVLMWHCSWIRKLGCLEKKNPLNSHICSFTLFACRNQRPLIEQTHGARRARILSP